MKDYMQPGTLEKFAKDDLHEGHIESPVKASGLQSVKETQKGTRMSMPKGTGRSVAKKMLYAEKEKDEC